MVQETINSAAHSETTVVSWSLNNVDVGQCLVNMQGQCGVAYVQPNMLLQNNTSKKKLKNWSVKQNSQLPFAVSPLIDSLNVDALQVYIVHMYPNCIQCTQFADIDWIGGDYRGDYTDHGSVMRSCPSLAAVPRYASHRRQTF